MAGLLQGPLLSPPRLRENHAAGAVTKGGSGAYRDPGWGGVRERPGAAPGAVPGLPSSRPAGASASPPAGVGRWRGALEDTDRVSSHRATLCWAISPSARRLNYTALLAIRTVPRASSRSKVGTALGPPGHRLAVASYPRPSICPFLPISCHRLSPELLSCTASRGT